MKTRNDIRIFVMRKYHTGLDRALRQNKIQAPQFYRQMNGEIECSAAIPKMEKMFGCDIKTLMAAWRNDK